MIKFEKDLSWFKQFYPTKIEQMENFIKNESIPHLIFTGKKCKDKGLIAKLFAEKFTENGGKYTFIFGSDPITQKERAKAKSMSYISSSKLGSAAGESRLINPFINVRIKPFVEEGTLDNKFRILIIWDFDKLGKEQEYFRRLMEDYSENCRMIFIVDNIGNIIDPIISRCNIFYFPSISNKNFEKGLSEIFDNNVILKPESILALEKFSDHSFMNAILISSASINKYKIINSQTCKNVIRKKSIIDIMIKEISALRFNLALSEIQRYLQYNSISWNYFAEEFANKILLSSYIYRYDAILLLAKFDEKYNEEDVGYYITYFLIKLKEIYGK